MTSWGFFPHICPLKTCFWPLEIQTKPLQMAAAPVAAAGWLGGWSAGVFLTQGPSVRRLTLACKRPDVGSNISQRPATANHTLMVSPGGFLRRFQMIQFQKFPCSSNKRLANGIAHERNELHTWSSCCLLEWGIKVCLLFGPSLDFNSFSQVC